MLYTVVDLNGCECHSSIPYCGYPYETLKTMADLGCTLLIDGKKAKFPTKAELSDAKAAYQPQKNR